MKKDLEISENENTIYQNQCKKDLHSYKNLHLEQDLKSTT